MNYYYFVAFLITLSTCFSLIFYSLSGEKKITRQKNLNKNYYFMSMKRRTHIKYLKKHKSSATCKKLILMLKLCVQF